MGTNDELEGEALTTWLEAVDRGDAVNRTPLTMPRWKRLRMKRRAKATEKRVIMRGRREGERLKIGRNMVMLVWPTEVGEGGWWRGLDAVVEGYGPVRSFAISPR